MLFNRTLDKPVTEWENKGTGLGIRANRDGTRVYVLKFRVNGRQVLKTIAPTSLVTLEDMRRLAARVKLIARAGDDPKELIYRLMDTKPAQLVTVQQMCELFMTRHSREHKKSWKKDRQLIDRHIVPTWGQRSLSEISRADISAAHVRLGKNSIFVANRVIELLHTIFNKAIIWGYLPEKHGNPAWGIQSYRERPRDRFIKSHEMAPFLAAVDAHPDIFVRTAIRLDLMTGLRVSELLKLRWDYIDLVQGELRLPDTKSGRVHLMPLPQDAIVLLRSLPRSVCNPFVFPGRVRGTHMSRIDKAFYKIRKEAGLHDLRFHDLRRTVGCSVLKHTGSLTMVGSVLGQTTDHVKRVYAHYELNEMREALERNASMLMEKSQ